ncbi:hypothetical protein ACTS35_25200 [Citrobacter freundii]|uniref:Uncharacterized protein n=1 Tax=Enterobacter asburiae TaxID=61645 RepID=A0A7W3DK00_ENTAS|nr:MULTISPECIES: hypothetical protein [Enterobacteriaceae]EFC7588673.1 hypothetical protein [Escherichia coli]EGK3177978.1 hypothetical protein [Salmonella enterica]EIC0790808.1 hypothetical protein [Salmonella enterica subsp. enterica serovar Livingstone]HAT7517087.1 hypothetical protein [Kluyvera ascorbata]EJG4277157.1 hypothetical protein [Salmonella enterica]
MRSSYSLVLPSPALADSAHAGDQPSEGYAVGLGHAPRRYQQGSAQE